MAEKFENRPPIVAILGHVDHGKTTLISKIKETDLTKKEFGGISQQIGAYQIDFQGKKITFIDTPGHIVFSQMRSRGAKVADLAILVVAANEGVKPQTVESLKHIEAAKIPYLVAINKIDLPDANINQTKTSLAENGILVEGFGGQIVAVPVSAKTGQGVPQLLEMVLLVAELAEIKADKEAPLEAVVIESRLEKSRGPMSTVVIRNGSLLVGDKVVVEGLETKIKAMFDEVGRKVSKALPGQPVEVLGFTFLPPAGAMVNKKGEKGLVFEDKPLPKQPVVPVVSQEETKKLRFVLRADTAGMLEAITSSLPSEVLIMSSGVGNISESDILLAVTTKADILGFHVQIPTAVSKLAETEKIKIKTYNIIYELLEDVDKKVLRLLEPTIDETILGEAEIKAVFPINKDTIAGCKVHSGLISRRDMIHLKRDSKIIASARVKSLKTGKIDVEKVKKDDECGIVFSPPIDFTIGDVIISYREEEEKEQNENTP